MIDIAVLEAMVVEGATAATIVRVVKMMVARDEAQRAQWRERKARSRSKPQVVTTTEHVSGHVTVTGQSRDLPYKEEKSPPAPPSKEEITPLVGRAKRATRLPEEWKPSEEAVKFANNHGWLGKSLDDEIIKFHNYWVSKSGQNATKCSWERTWQNWILNAGKPNGGTNGHSANPAAIRRTSDAVAETLARRQLDLYR